MTDDLLARINGGDRLRGDRAPPVGPEPGGIFVRGPLPWAWLSIASKLSATSLRLGLALFLEQGFRSSSIVKVARSRLAELGVSRQAAYRAVDLLAEHGLIEVIERRRGRQMVVRLLDAPKGAA